MKPNPAESPEGASRRRLCQWLLTPLLLWLSPSNANEDTVDRDCERPSTPTKQLVLIIDDMGNQLRRGQQALQLPGKITFAVIPFTPFGRQLAEQAASAGKEVMLHAPMSNTGDLPMGTGGLTAEHSKEEFRQALAVALAEIPQARGINNHMGSDLTQRRRQMAWLMQELRSRDLYFVDSRTSANTVAATVASEFNVPHLSRQVFLDNERNREAIDERFGLLLAKLDREPVAVGIGHPYPETIAYLEEALPLLEQRGITLAFVSDVLTEGTDSEQRAATPGYNLTSIPCSAI